AGLLGDEPDAGAGAQRQTDGEGAGLRHLRGVQCVEGGVGVQDTTSAAGTEMAPGGRYGPDAAAGHRAERGGAGGRGVVAVHAGGALAGGAAGRGMKQPGAQATGTASLACASSSGFLPHTVSASRCCATRSCARAFCWLTSCVSWASVP